MSNEAKLSRALSEFVSFLKLKVKNNLVEKSNEFELTKEQLQKVSALVDASVDQCIFNGSQIITNFDK